MGSDREKPPDNQRDEPLPLDAKALDVQGRVKKLTVKSIHRCFLCRRKIPLGPALRIDWRQVTRSEKIILFGYFHEDVCGPAMVLTLRGQTPRHDIIVSLLSKRTER